MLIMEKQRACASTMLLICSLMVGRMFNVGCNFTHTCIYDRLGILLVIENNSEMQLISVQHLSRL